MSVETLTGIGTDQIHLIEETVEVMAEVDRILTIEETLIETGIAVDQIPLIEDDHRDITPRRERIIGL